MGVFAKHSSFSNHLFATQHIISMIYIILHTKSILDMETRFAKKISPVYRHCVRNVLWQTCWGYRLRDAASLFFILFKPNNM